MQFADLLATRFAAAFSAFNALAIDCLANTSSGVSSAIFAAFNCLATSISSSVRTFFDLGLVAFLVFCFSSPVSCFFLLPDLGDLGDFGDLGDVFFLGAS